jgi:hypothetical protein
MNKENNICKTCNWEEISNFTSLGEYNRFVKWIFDKKRLGILEEIPISNNYKWSKVGKVWFQCKECKKKWMLSMPDGPLRGSFLIVKDEWLN